MVAEFLINELLSSNNVGLILHDPLTTENFVNPEIREIIGADFISSIASEFNRTQFEKPTIVEVNRSNNGMAIEKKYLWVIMTEIEGNDSEIDKKGYYIRDITNDIGTMIENNMQDIKSAINRGYMLDINELDQIKEHTREYLLGNLQLITDIAKTSFTYEQSFYNQIKQTTDTIIHNTRMMVENRNQIMHIVQDTIPVSALDIEFTTIDITPQSPTILDLESLNEEVQNNISNDYNKRLETISPKDIDTSALIEYIKNCSLARGIQDRFASLQHETSTPITTIISSISILEDYADRISEENRAKKKEIIQNAITSTIDGLITNIVLLTSEIEKEELDENNLKIIIDNLDIIKNNSDIKIDIQIGSLKFQGNPDFIMRAISNTVKNITTHAEATSAQIKVTEYENYVEIRISDDGQKSFTTSDFYIETQYEPKNISKRGRNRHHGIKENIKIAELHGGVFFLDENPEEGYSKTFVLRLPLSN